MTFASWGPLGSFPGTRVELGSRFESAAPGIWHLAFAPGICIALQLALHLAFYIFTFVIWRRGARNEEAGEEQEGCNATLCVAMPRHAMLCCAMISCIVSRKKTGAARLF